jgi:hypothetical protein
MMLLSQVIMRIMMLLHHSSFIRPCAKNYLCVKAVDMQIFFLA